MLNESTSRISTESAPPVVTRRTDGVARPKTMVDLLRMLEVNRHGLVARVTVWLAPDVARDMLTKNHPKNRAVGPGHLKKLVQQHQNGRFLYTPAPIILGPDGTLGDGQHRATMVTQTGAAIMVDVVQMFDATQFEAARLVVDTGRTRTRGHVLEIAGLVASGKGATANGILSRIGYFHDGIDATRTNMDQVAMFRPWAGAIGKALALGRKWNLPMRAAIAVALRHNPGTAEDMIREFETNVDLRPGMPGHALVQMQAMFSKGRGRAHEEDVMLFILKAAHKRMTGSLLRPQREERVRLLHAPVALRDRIFLRRAPPLRVARAHEAHAQVRQRRGVTGPWSRTSRLPTSSSIPSCKRASAWTRRGSGSWPISTADPTRCRPCRWFSMGAATS